MMKNGGKIAPSEVGISDASVFYGFCAHHDRTLFSCIENEVFTGRPDQCLAIAYRTMSREYYGKHAGSHIRETLRDADKGRSPFEQVQLQTLLDLIDQGNELAKKDLQGTHDKLTKAMVEKSPSVLRSTIIEFEGPLPFMVAGAWSPFTDFFGNELQKGYVDEQLEQVFISSFADADWSKVCVSWLDGPKTPGKVIADQLRGLEDEQRATGCLQLFAKHIENTFYSPAWFETLSVVERDQLYKLATSGVDTLGSVPSAEIKLDLKFGLTGNSRIFLPPSGGSAASP